MRSPNITRRPQHAKLERSTSQSSPVKKYEEQHVSPSNRSTKNTIGHKGVSQAKDHLEYATNLMKLKGNINKK